MIMLHLWIAKKGNNVVTADLERGLRKVGRDDIVEKYIYGIGLDSPPLNNTVTTGDGAHGFTGDRFSARWVGVAKGGLGRVDPINKVITTMVIRPPDDGQSVMADLRPFVRATWGSG